jgi:hypothetical protein
MFIYLFIYLVRSPLVIKVVKIGAGLQIVYERLDQVGLPRGGHILKFRAMFPDGISLVFGTGTPATS